MSTVWAVLGRAIGCAGGYSQRGAWRASSSVTASFTSTDTTHVGVAGSNGLASITFRIGRATVGTEVPVAVTVTKGSATGSCSTSFTPQ